MSQADLRLPFSATDLTGGVTIAHQVIAKLAGKAAQGHLRRRRHAGAAHQEAARFFRGSLSEGVELDVGDGSVDIGLHVIMERGVNIAQVTANLQEQVRYQVERVCGVPVGEINVRVEDLQD